MLAKKLRVAYPILLVVAGLLIGFIPGTPDIRIDPEWLFIIFLPPLLYEAAWATSWKELWRWRRIVCSFAFIIVFLSALTVAIVANQFIPGFSLALGFLLGGIVSPPDAVSTGSILKFVRVPKRIASILEGESLLNDASSLIIFRFALVAVATGQFVWHRAAIDFSWMVAGGVGIGLLVGWIFIKAHKKLPTDTNIDIILTLLAPYFMYLLAEKFHSSGVLAVVSGGLYLSNYRHEFLSSQSRLRGVNFWESFSFIMNGAVFLIIGLGLPEIVAGIKGTSIWTALGYGVLITAVLIVVRMLSAYGAVAVTMVMKNIITVADDQHPGYRGPTIIGWAGMRGVISLAAALSIPVYLQDGTAFPQRNLILFITFIVILLTLVVQGLTLPLLIKKLNVPDPDFTIPEEELHERIKKKMAELALQHLQTAHAEKYCSQPVLKIMARKWQHEHSTTDSVAMTPEVKQIYKEIFELQRSYLLNKNKELETLDEDIIRRHLYHLDIEEVRLGYL